MTFDVVSTKEYVVDPEELKRIFPEQWQDYADDNALDDFVVDMYHEHGHEHPVFKEVFDFGEEVIPVRD